MVPANRLIGARGADRVQHAVRAVPPEGLALCSMIFVQLGAARAKDLFHTLGPSATVFLRVAFAALFLLAVWRPRLRGHSRADFAAVILFGLIIAGMNLCFYLALSRLPLGIAVTVEFIGPLGVALIGSRQLVDLLWILLGAAGILLLAPLSGTALDPLGLLLALLAGVGWGAYILAGPRAGRAFAGGSGLAVAMAASALALLPVGLISGGKMLLNPSILYQGAIVAVLSTIVPFSLEFEALPRIPARIFGVLMSIEPAIAALVGFVLLGESVKFRGLVAVALVSAAAAGASWSNRDDRAH